MRRCAHRHSMLLLTFCVCQIVFTSVLYRFWSIQKRMSRWECRVRYRYINVYWKIDWYCMPYICHDTTNLCVGWWDRGVDVQSIEWIRIEPVAMRRHTLTQSHPQQKSVLCVHFIWFHFFFNFNIHTILARIYWLEQMCFTRLYIVCLCYAWHLFSFPLSISLQLQSDTWIPNILIVQPKRCFQGMWDYKWYFTLDFKKKIRLTFTKCHDSPLIQWLESNMTHFSSHESTLSLSITFWLIHHQVLKSWKNHLKKKCLRIRWVY